ncbi:acyl-CoA dehydrogenase family protein [Haloferax denitrificans]|uniref:acyl-CoA dehydrogenase family protein n=1 Tax=Haloferax denitrificans TaxID=35745 RepID=UPI003C6F28DB
MAYELTESHDEIRERVRAFGEEAIAPVAREYDRTAEYPDDIIAEAAESGLVGANVPSEYGGLGLDSLEMAIYTEELWRADPGIGLAIQARSFGSTLLLDQADEQLCETWLPRITAGEVGTCMALTEPDYGSDMAGIQTRAERDGDEWTLTGKKKWITGASVADVAIIIARTTQDAEHRGLTAFLVPTDRDGFEATPITGKLGIRAADVAGIELDDVRIPKENVVGEVDRGFYHLLEFFETERVNVAAQAVGVAQAALDAATDYANSRTQGEKPIKEYQAIQHKIAEMGSAVEAARSLTYRAASAGDRGDDDAMKLASMAKQFASERAVEVADEAVQVHGGPGYVEDNLVEKYYRDARITKIYEGTNEIQKNIIARELL